MIWLITHMWIYLALAVVFGMLAHRWVFGRARGGLSAEDASAELASVRTRHQESESQRARLRAKVMELTQQLDETRRELRSAKAEAHVATLKGGGVPSVTPGEPEPSTSHDSASSGPASNKASASTTSQAASPAPAPAPAPAQSSSPAAPEPTSGASSSDTSTSPTFYTSADQGPADDLKKIKGIGAKLEKTLNSLGVYYYRQIAGWTDTQVDEVDVPLKFPGRIHRDKWRSQAKALDEADD